MKIEMGESLGASWMKRVRQCVIVQTNWKPSHSWELKNRKTAEALYHDARQYFKELNVDIFKKNTSLDQMLRQTECDVLGMGFEEDGRICWTAMEVAFHEDGLNYNGEKKTIAKVAAKLFRIALCLHTYLDAKYMRLVFATPRTHGNWKTKIVDAISAVEALYKTSPELMDVDVQFSLVADEDFRKEILLPVLNNDFVPSEGSELFLESTRMVQKYGIDPGLVMPDDTDEAQSAVFKFARENLPTLLLQVPKDEIEGFCDEDWCQETFGIDQPLLRLVGEGDFSQENEGYDENIRLTLKDGKEYLFTNQWHALSRGRIEAFIQKSTLSDEDVELT